MTELEMRRLMIKKLQAEILRRQKAGVSMKDNAEHLKKRYGEMSKVNQSKKKVIKKVRPEADVKKTTKTAVTKKQDKREQLVSELSCRWNYALPEYPPKCFDYGSFLKKDGYRLVAA